MATVPAIGTLIFAAGFIFFGSVSLATGGNLLQAAFDIGMGVLLAITACTAYRSKARLAALWTDLADTDEPPIACHLIYPNGNVVPVHGGLAHHIPGVPDMTKQSQPQTISDEAPHVDPYEWKLNEGAKE